MVATRFPYAALVVAAGAAGLAVTNPGPEEFQEFAGRRLVDTITREICVENTLPMAVRVLLDNCPDLVASQQRVLGRIALEHSSRTNLGLASVYRTELGGQQLLAELRVPRYEAVTVAGAGQFLLVSTSQSQPK